MAIFYNYIKGCGPNATKGTINVGTGSSLDPAATWTSVDDHWAFLKWSDKLWYYKKDEIADFRYFSNNPELFFNNSTSLSPSANLSTGRIITSAARAQEMFYDLTFKDGPALTNSTHTPTKNTKFEQTDKSFYTETSDWTIKDTSNPMPDGKANTVLHLYGKGSEGGPKLEINYPLEVNDSIKTLTAKGAGIQTSDSLTTNHSTTSIYGSDVLISGSTYFNISDTQSNGAMLIPSSPDSSIQVYRNLEIDSSKYCQAGYFNATSDARAKENIRKADFSALSIINSLPVYNFNYKNSDKPSIGVIAQEAAGFNIDDFSLVENIEATGENNDYMSIKESKLIYVLWKAIQEQQEEIELLKQQLRGDK